MNNIVLFFTDEYMYRVYATFLFTHFPDDGNVQITLDIVTKMWLLYQEDHGTWAETNVSEEEREREMGGFDDLGVNLG